MTDVLFQKFSHIRPSIELLDDVLGSEGGAASFVERWPNIDLGELNLAQVMYQSHPIQPSTLSTHPSIHRSIHPFLDSGSIHPRFDAMR